MSSSISSSPDWIFAMVSSTATSALRFVPDWSPAQWLQVFYIVATGLVLGVAILPKRARGYLLTYGARGAKPEGGDQRRETAAQDGSSGQYRDEDQDADNAQETSADQEGDHDQGGHDGPEREDGPDTAASSERADGPDGEVVQPGENGQEDWFAKFVAFVTSCGQIPHSWFGGFYAVSLACSVFWLVQYLTDGRILHFLTTRQDAASAPGMEPGQVVLLWTMMFLQGCRRLLESLVLVKPGSKSTMWIVHWLLGNVYYITMSLSVWIEGSDAILQRRLLSDLTGLISPKTVVATLVYLYAAISQYQCHKHLAGLKKYSLPNRGAFRFLICPHYTFECLLYLSMAVAGAPKGAVCNMTLICGLLFVVSNLSVTAGTTRKWYIGKFGADAVKKRWNIIPFLY